MKKKLLIVRSTRITARRFAEIETARRFLNENTKDTWEFQYIDDKNLANNLVIEDNDNLDEHAIKSYINRPDVGYIHLDITDFIWRRLKLRPTLYGQAELIDGQGITYGRWTQRNAKRVKELPKELHYLSEVGLGIIHEVGHIEGFKRKLPYSTHYYFYGFEKKLSAREEKIQKPKRYVRVPDPQVLFSGEENDTKEEITLVLHNTAVSRSKAPLQRDAVNKYHRQRWNSPSSLNGSFIGYNYFCEPTGKRTQERSIGEETIAVIGYNWDVPSRGGYVHYCMAGYFKVEKPTQFQVDDLKLLIKELEAQGYTIKVVLQHKDLDSRRTCAELSTDELQKLFTPTQPTSSKDKKIAQLEQEVADCHGMIKQLKGIVTSLIKYITK